jgi:hypothetical protein
MLSSNIPQPHGTKTLPGKQEVVGITPAGNNPDAKTAL